jgi:hypothetical protein
MFSTSVKIYIIILLLLLIIYEKKQVIFEVQPYCRFSREKLSPFRSTVFRSSVGELEMLETLNVCYERPVKYPVEALCLLSAFKSTII